MKMVAYLDWHDFMAKDDWPTLQLDKSPSVEKPVGGIRIRFVLDVPDQADEEQVVRGRVVKDADERGERVEKSILAAGSARGPVKGRHAEPEIELWYCISCGLVRYGTKATAVEVPCGVDQTVKVLMRDCLACGRKTQWHPVPGTGSAEQKGSSE